MVRLVRGMGIGKSSCMQKERHKPSGRIDDWITRHWFSLADVNKYGPRIIDR